mmetsp:Transcript_48024/g.109053  ORF Transcript_48024/g.109053 Transcript_48024/m.109053 type:complete len:217 (+) Transcript_48024:929-1579(+)
MSPRAEEVAQHAQLEAEGPRARERCHEGLPPRHAVAQVHRAVRDAGRRLEGGEQPLSEVQRQPQQRPVVAQALALALAWSLELGVDVKHGVDGEHVGGEKPTEEPDVRLKHAHVDVEVESVGEGFGNESNCPPELRVVPQHHQRVQCVDQRNRRHPRGLEGHAAAAQGAELAHRVPVPHVRVVAVHEEPPRRFAHVEALLGRHDAAAAMARQRARL